MVDVSFVWSRSDKEMSCVPKSRVQLRWCGCATRRLLLVVIICPKRGNTYRIVYSGWVLHQDGCLWWCCCISAFCRRGAVRVTSRVTSGYREHNSRKIVSIGHLLRLIELSFAIVRTLMWSPEYTSNKCKTWSISMGPTLEGHSRVASFMVFLDKWPLETNWYRFGEVWKGWWEDCDELHDVSRCCDMCMNSSTFPRLSQWVWEVRQWFFFLLLAHDPGALSEVFEKCTSGFECRDVLKSGVSWVCVWSWRLLARVGDRSLPRQGRLG
jgi:hypothetical protein